MKRYAVLYAPNFRLQATLRYCPQLAGQPVGLLDSTGKKPHVCELTAPALAARVEVGMSPTQAKARCAELHLVSGNFGHERAAHDVLLQTAETISPFLEATAPGVVTVEWPSEKPPDEKQLAVSLVDPLCALGLGVRVGLAATPFLALLASRFAEPVQIIGDAALFMAPLPLTVLDPSDEIRDVLHAWGIRTVGDLLALPASQVGERLGPGAVELWERATGGRPRPLKLVKPQEFFSEQADLENPVEMLEPLLFLLRRFLEQITARLAQVYLVVGKLRLVLRFEHDSPYQRVFTIPQPTRDVSLLFRMLHTHLENFTSESPIMGLELAAKPVRPGTEQFGLLEKGLRDPHQLAETLARLGALVGADRVGTPELQPSAHPDAFHLRPYNAAAMALSSPDAPLIGVPWMRFTPPVPAKIRLNDGEPVYLESPRFTGRIKETSGPWLLEGNWWESRRWSREEWDAATEGGVYRLVQAGTDWFLDGIYV
jgi:protein ImuB